MLFWKTLDTRECFLVENAQKKENLDRSYPLVDLVVSRRALPRLHQRVGRAPVPLYTLRPVMPRAWLFYTIQKLYEPDFEKYL